MNYLKHIGTFLSKKSPTILTAVGSAGVLATAIMAAKATPKALDRLTDNDDYYHDPESFSFWQKVKVVYPVYIPSAVMAATTIICVIGANSTNLRKQAAIASLYTMSERSFQEFREKAVEQLGAAKTDRIYEAVAEDRVRNAEGADVVILGDGEVLCFETLSGRYFKSSVERIRKAANDINAQCINDMYASMNEFYSKVGLSQIPMGEEVGWNTDNMLEVKFTSVLSEENKPVLAVDYVYAPKTDYFRLWK